MGWVRRNLPRAHGGAELEPRSPIPSISSRGKSPKAMGRAEPPGCCSGTSVRSSHSAERAVSSAPCLILGAHVGDLTYFVACVPLQRVKTGASQTRGSSGQRQLEVLMSIRASRYSLSFIVKKQPFSQMVAFLSYLKYLLTLQL